MAGDNIPSLAELSPHGTDPELSSTGIPANVINNQVVADGLLKSAQFRAENKWRRYTQELANFKDVIKDAQDVAGIETMPQDSPALKKRLADVMGKISFDPHGFFSGNLADVEKDLIGIKQDATKSGQQYLFDKFNREQIAKDPSFDTPQNRQLIDQYGNADLNSRKPFLLRLTPAFDFDTFDKGLRTASTTGTTSDEVGGVKVVNGEQQFDPTGQGYIRTTTGTLLSKDKYLRGWDAGWNTENNQYGQPVKNIVTEQYDDLVSKNPSIKDKFPTPFDYYHWLGESKFGSDKDITSDKTVKLAADPNFTKQQQLDIERGKLNVERGKLGLDWAKYNSSTGDDIYGADSAIGEASSIISKGVNTTAQNFEGTGKNKKVLQIADPNILNLFGKVDKDGKTTNIPDVLQYDPTNDNLYLTYYTRKDDPNSTEKEPKQVIDYDAQGDPYVEKRIPLDARTWLTEIVKRQNPNKDIGTINRLVDKALKDNGNSLFKLSQKYNARASAKEEDGSTDISKLEDGNYTIKSGKNKGKVVTIKGGQAVSIQ
jgi:hypothetical protein